MTTEQLLKKYPFLQQKDFKGTPIAGYTFLDDLPRGWVKRFGESLCKDIKQALIEHNCLNDYEIFQVKEKYGEIRWYDNYPEITDEIIDYYNQFIHNTCAVCGTHSLHYKDGVAICKNCLRNFL